MFKKSQGISLNMIVIAAIVIIVLVVVIAIFSGKMRFFEKGVRSCRSQGGHCSCWTEYGDDIDWKTPTTSCSNNPNECPEGYGPVEGTDCTADKITGNDLCCIKVY